MGLTLGAAVSANSSSAVVTVVGPNQYTVTTSIPLTKIDKVKVGQAASVTVNGVDKAIDGKVSMIGILAAATGSNPTYSVVLNLGTTSTTLFNGAGASATITVGDVNGALTVPSSAVTTVGSAHSVTVLENGNTKVVQVEIGAVGPALTEITSGLSQGQQVVLANLSEPLPTSSSSSRSGAGLLGGNGGGAGRVPGAGGFGGAPAVADARANEGAAPSRPTPSTLPAIASPTAWRVASWTRFPPLHENTSAVRDGLRRNRSTISSISSSAWSMSVRN